MPEKMGKVLANKWAIAVSIAALVLIGSSIYTWQNRYYLRFIPIPLNYIEVVNNESLFFPASQRARPLGEIPFTPHDLTDESGLRKTLNAIQGFSPMAANTGVVNYEDITFERWVSQIRQKPFYCTDATQLFILAAWAQGLKAREWHLLPPGWPPGQGHSVAEFFNPVSGTWQLVDAQHAAVVRGTSGRILGMAEVLRRIAKDGGRSVVIDYGPFRDQMLRNARGPSTEQYFFESGLLATPVLQLQQATWFAEISRPFMIRGHFVIGYPIVIAGWNHDDRVLYAKLSALGMILAAFSILGFGMAWRKSLSAG